MHVHTILGMSNKLCFYISCTWQGGGQRICYLNLSESPAPPHLMGLLINGALRQSLMEALQLLICCTVPLQPDILVPKLSTPCNRWKFIGENWQDLLPGNSLELCSLITFSPLPLSFFFFWVLCLSFYSLLFPFSVITHSFLLTLLFRPVSSLFSGPVCAAL